MLPRHRRATQSGADFVPCVRRVGWLRTRPRQCATLTLHGTVGRSDGGTTDLGQWLKHYRPGFPQSCGSLITIADEDIERSSLRRHGARVRNHRCRLEAGGCRPIRRADERRLAGLSRRPEGQSILGARADSCRQRPHARTRVGVQDRRRESALDDARESDRGQRRDVRDHAEPQGGGAERGDRPRGLVVRPGQVQQRQRRPSAQPRRGATGRGPRGSGSSTSCAIASTRWTPRPAP